MTVATATAPTNGRVATEPTPWERLREPFTGEKVQKLVKTWTDKKSGEEKSFEVDYVGHALVTERLLEVDPQWNWEPASRDVDRGILLAAVATGNADIVRAVIDNSPPAYDREDGDPVGMWMRLTVNGVTRLGYGSVEKGAVEPEKQLIGDALRNAAMRQGVALHVWVKDEQHQRSKDSGKPAVAPEDDYGLCDEAGCSGRLVAKVAGKNKTRMVECSEHGYVGKDGKRRGGPCTRETDWAPNWAWYEAHRNRSLDASGAPSEGELLDNTLRRLIDLGRIDADGAKVLCEAHGWDGVKKSTEWVASLRRPELLTLLSDINGAITSNPTDIPFGEPA